MTLGHLDWTQCGNSVIMSYIKSSVLRSGGIDVLRMCAAALNLEVKSRPAATERSAKEVNRSQVIIVACSMLA